MSHTRILLAVVAVLVVSSAAWAQVGHNNGVLNPNLATVAEMAAVPHLDENAAAAIIDGRPYLSATDLDAKLREFGLSDEQRAEVFVKLFVPINLDTASTEEILLVPGAGQRMAREFAEYRPWEGGMLRFRREIGKYVDDDEVARLAQYVFVPLDLNGASDEDFLTIPGVGDRMVREFKEYRPWVSFEQFRREIGKYVDDNEVARLERYFVIKDNQ
ncbi:MAG: hypothetical protein PVJ49_21280 [Acidobacteriota bacterium]|jgi:DNA uptake protein ComE-like DNA-binding protein